MLPRRAVAIAPAELCAAGNAQTAGTAASLPPGNTEETAGLPAAFPALSSPLAVASGRRLWRRARAISRRALAGRLGIYALGAKRSQRRARIAAAGQRSRGFGDTERHSQLSAA